MAFTTTNDALIETMLDRLYHNYNYDKSGIKEDIMEYYVRMKYDEHGKLKEYLSMKKLKS